MASEAERRSLAVEIVDYCHGYTMEFSSSPERHAQEYDWVEDRLAELADRPALEARVAKAFAGPDGYPGDFLALARIALDAIFGEAGE